MKMRILRKQAGVTLLEVVVAVGVLGVVVAGTASLFDQYGDNLRSNVIAEHSATFGKAVESYIKDNYSAVAAAATPTTPALIDVGMLTSTNVLPAGFNASNSFGQTLCALVLEPSAGKLQAVVIAEGGTPINDVDLGRIAATIGGAGAGVYTSAPSVIRGAMGGFGVPVGNFANANNVGRRCDGSVGAVQFAAGHPAIMLSFNAGDTSAGALYRDAIPGQPQLNQMNTPLVMASVQTSGSGCTTTGAIARDSSGAIVSCQAGQWKEAGGSNYWKDPVASFAALPASGNTLGDVRLTTDVRRAYAWTGASWQALAVDQSGNLNVPGTVTATTVTASTVNGTVVNGSSSVNTATLNTTNAYVGNYLNAYQANTGYLSANTYFYNYGGMTSYARDYSATHDWALTTYAGDWNAYAEPQSARASLYVNDIYLRATGRWLSQGSGIGVGQRWVNYTGSRCNGCVYYNYSGRPIMVNVSIDSWSGGQIVGYFYVDGVNISAYNYNNQRYNNNSNFSAIVPHGSYYYMSGWGDNFVISNWSELI